MTYKHTVTLGKTWANTGSIGMVPSGIIAKLLNAVKMQIPTGYQDETGFHTGVKRAEKNDKWPSVW
jgi:hypothetical protein